MRTAIPLIVALCATSHAVAGEDGSEETAAGWGDAADWGDAAVEEPKVHEVRFYGFIDAYGEYVAPAPSGVDDAGQTEWGSGEYAYDVANLHFMVQGSIHNRYRYFLNLAAPGAGGVTGDEPLQVRNAWVEAPIKGQYLQVRAGKTYRRFGLYNEILDAVPTFIGIEPPEMFDKDHLMLTRTTNLMVHGSAPVGGSIVSYSLSTGNDENAGMAVPLGADLRVNTGGVFTVGSSFYTSGGPAGPSRGVGEGSPRGGVANWMAEDRYTVWGGFAELNTGHTIVQTEYFRADHNAVRDEKAVLELADGGLNPRQMKRFFVSGDPNQGITDPEVQYTVQTAYVRAAQQFSIGKKKTTTITPYVQADWYSNPEIVESKSLGGDAEAGQADDGSFFKYTAGAVVRPVPEVALKIDGSAHHFTFNDEMVFYPEVRVSFSYLWQLDL